MSVIDEVLWLLRDGEWHDVKEIRENVSLSKFRVEMVVNFLEEYNFVQLDMKVGRIRLQPSILEFINKIQLIEEEEALSH
jgi:DNA-binding transcriptional regulator GbsR (MarR family)